MATIKSIPRVKRNTTTNTKASTIASEEGILQRSTWKSTTGDTTVVRKTANTKGIITALVYTKPAAKAITAKTPSDPTASQICSLNCVEFTAVKPLQISTVRLIK